jgi:hypothetical protein
MFNLKTIVALKYLISILNSHLQYLLEKDMIIMRVVCYYVMEKICISYFFHGIFLIINTNKYSSFNTIPIIQSCFYIITTHHYYETNIVCTRLKFYSFHCFLVNSIFFATMFSSTFHTYALIVYNCHQTHFSYKWI